MLWWEVDHVYETSPNSRLHEEESWFGRSEKCHLPTDLHLIDYPNINCNIKLHLHEKSCFATSTDRCEGTQGYLFQRLCKLHIKTKQLEAAWLEYPAIIFRAGWGWNDSEQLLGTAVTTVSITWATTVITWTPTTTAWFTMLFDPRKPWCCAVTSKLLLWLHVWKVIVYRI